MYRRVPASTDLGSELHWAHVVLENQAVCSKAWGPSLAPWAQGHPSPSSWEMPSTDLWRIPHSCRDLVRSEKRLLGTSIVSMLQCW